MSLLFMQFSESSMSQTLSSMGTAYDKIHYKRRPYEDYCLKKKFQYSWPQSLSQLSLSKNLQMSPKNGSIKI